MMKPVCQIFTR